MRIVGSTPLSLPPFCRDSPAPAAGGSLLKFYAPQDKTYWLLLIAAISPTLQLHGGPLRGPSLQAGCRRSRVIGRRLTIARRLPLSDFIPTIAEIPPVARRYLLSITLNIHHLVALAYPRLLLSVGVSVSTGRASKPEGKPPRSFPVKAFTFCNGNSPLFYVIYSRYFWWPTRKLIRCDLFFLHVAIYVRHTQLPV